VGRNFNRFREDLILLRQIGIDEVQTPHNKRLALIAILGKSPPSNLTVEQRLNLGAYLVRLRRYRDSAAVLSPAMRQDAGNFLILANLGTAEFLDGQPVRAAAYLADALRAWPEDWEKLGAERRKWLTQIGWDRTAYLNYRTAEKYHLDLVNLRTREPAKDGLPQAPDNLFGPVQFVGESGKYEAGKLASAERAKLPDRALEIVQQLVLWMPDDTRLYWLLGELFNAVGDAPAALQIFEEVANKWNPPEKAGFKRVVLPQLFRQHLEVLRAQPRVEVSLDETPKKENVPPTENETSAVDWRALGIGFGAGLLVALFGYWQVREIRRRLHARSEREKALPPRTA
jgi:tetratricopeptide (TPR) repeat protein